MPSTFTTNLGIEKIGTGEQSGTWGTTTNENFDIIDQAVNGVETVVLASAGTSGAPNTLPITDGAVSSGRNAFIEFSDGGDLGATAFVQLTPNDAEKIVHVRNSLSGSRSLTLFQGTYNASNDYVLAAGADALLKFSGAGASATVTQVMENPSFDGNLTVGGNIAVGGTVDGRDVASDGSKLDGIAPAAQTGTVTSVATSNGTGISVTGGPITTSGTLTITNTAPDTGTPAILSNGSTPSLNSGITAAEVRSLIGAGTSSSTGTVTSVGSGTGLTGGPITTSGTLSLATAGVGAGTYGSTANGTKIDQITVDAYGRITAITTGATGTATVNDTGTPAILSNGSTPSLNSGITGAEVRSLIGAGTSSTTGTVTSVSGANGISGTVTTSGSLTLDSDLRGHVTLVGASTSDYYQSTGTVHQWILDGTEDMRLTNNGQLDVEGNVVAYSTTVSDERLKDNVETIANPLNTVAALRGVTFEWNKGHRKGQKDIGVIAQEIQAVLPELIVEAKDSLIDGEDYLTVSYGQMAGLFIECFKEVITRLEALENK